MTKNLLEVRLSESEDFLKIVETLTRIGVVTKDKRLIQTCHILHKQQKYYICHFKELFLLDGVAKTQFDETDLKRRNGIANLLEEWNLCEVVDKSATEEKSLDRIKIISFAKKREYELRQNYTIGGKKP